MIELVLRDPFGNRSTLNQYGVPVAYAQGPAQGVHSITYTQDGNLIDGVPDLRFSVPLTLRANQPLLADGTQVTIVEDGVEYGPFVITASSEMLAANGVDAIFNCPDALQELIWANTTSGFATLPGETLARTLARLVGMQTETVWASATDVTNLDGVPFSCYGHSALQAAAKLSSERLLHFKRGIGRTLLVGAFGESSGLRLIDAAPDGASASRNPAIRQIISFKRDVDLNYLNDIVVTGNGTGEAQLTMADAYVTAGETALGNGWYRSGPPAYADGLYSIAGIPWPLYNPEYPLYRRPRQDAVASEARSEYFLQTPALSGSAGAVPRRKQGPYQRPDIQAVSTEQGDVTLAAMALYALGVRELELNAQPLETLTIATEARGDLRGIGGKTVRVTHEEWNDGVLTRAIDSDYFVLHVERQKVGESGAQDVWTFASKGRGAKTNQSVIVGALSTIDNIVATPQRMVAPRGKQREADIDASHPIDFSVPGNKRIVATLQATLFLYLQPLRANAIPLAHTHTVPVPATPLDVSALPHDVNALPHDVSALTSFQFRIGGTPTPTGQVNFDPATRLYVKRGTPPSSAHPMYYDPATGFFYVQDSGSGSAFSQLASNTLQIFQTNPTSGGTGGTVKATTGATGGRVKATSGGAGGTTMAANTTSATAVGMSYGVNPLAAYTPYSVWVAVDSGAWLGPYSAAENVVDLTPYWGSGRNDHIIHVKSDGDAGNTTNPTGLGHVLLDLETWPIITTLVGSTIA